MISVCVCYEYAPKVLALIIFLNQFIQIMIRQRRPHTNTHPHRHTHRHTHHTTHHTHIHTHIYIHGHRSATLWWLPSILTPAFAQGLMKRSWYDWMINLLVGQLQCSINSFRNRLMVHYQEVVQEVINREISLKFQFLVIFPLNQNIPLCLNPYFGKHN